MTAQAQLGYRWAAGFLDLTKAQRRDICNGAGARGVWYSRFIPNTLWGLDCEEVFDGHDYAYWVGRGLAAKRDADLDMLHNLLIKINHSAFDSLGARLLSPARRRRALKYYEAVHLKGGDAYWANKPALRRRKSERRSSSI